MKGFQREIIFWGDISPGSYLKASKSWFVAGNVLEKVGILVCFLSVPFLNIWLHWAGQFKDVEGVFYHHRLKCLEPKS